MRKKLIHNYILIILISVAITVGAFVFYGYSYLVNENEKSLTARVNLVADFFTEQDIQSVSDLEKYIDKYAEDIGLRLTFINEEGNVLADSEADSSDMENHRTRPEVRRAFRNEVGSDHRYSKTVGIEYYYAAVRVELNGFTGVIRASEPAETFEALIDTLTFSIAVMILVCIGIAMVLVYYQSKRIMEPIEYMTKKSEEIAEGHYNGSILVDGTDEVARLAKSFNKMTKSLRIEQERVISRKEELSSILKSMNSGVVALESNGRILFYNAPFAHLIQFEDNEEGDKLLGKSFYRFFRNEEVIDVISQVEEEEKPIRGETVITLDEKEMILLIKGTPLYKKAKRKFGTLLILEDVTRMKKLENIRKDFVSNVTHELKTPLTSIRGFVDTLKNGAIDDPAFARRFLDIIDIEAERLSILVNDILILSEIEAGNESGKSMVHVEEVIDEVIELLEKKGKENVAILKDMERPVTDFLCNRHRLKELIINLADNGLKYTNEGSVIIKCWEEENDLLLQFIDTGVGIPKEHIPRLFERFYRVDKGRSRKQGGTGLGLSIVKHLVELYRGTITVESEPDKGSVFTVRLPYYE